MSKRCDAYLLDHLTTSYELVNYRHCNYYKGSKATQVKEQLPYILKWALFAEAEGLPRTLQRCEAWLAHHFADYPDAYQHLCFLKNSSMVRILLLQKDRISSP